ncbi:TIR domain-containing protein [Lentzea sp. BCCO 10_0856]|uniref:TIR domain-containing protein n=1 Tax=Lentzea miocenica TaxID=3095431 RepID=A0ABU4T537_9PSEU|nr:TIR domain-containing protein [Lentzea sp. BCCO 10_0856]MDX8033269.1 TIR domain-containing protein [Lentzea sp. BCCO 10_0856]
MTSLFISFGGQDRAIATEVRNRLRDKGYEALFLDFDPADGVPAGRRWERELYVQLRKSDGVVFLASDTSVHSRWCFAEVSLARSLGRPVFPVRIAEGAWLELLGDTQWADLADGEDAFAKLWRGLRRAGLDPADSFSWDPARSPYPGLEPFGRLDAAVFFGRDQEIGRLLELLAPTLRHGGGRFVAIIGPSGSGKSSLLHAGLLPRLERLPEQWFVVPPLLPGAQPSRSLAHSISKAFEAFGRQVTVDEVASRLPDGLASLGAELAGLSRSRAVLVVIDQAEELVDHQGFLAGLRAGLREDSPLWVVATVRSDRTGLAEMIDDALVVEPLSRARLPEVVERPAQRAGIEFAPGLVARMVEESTGGDALPLLACTLQQLYERVGAEGTATIADYDAIDGVVGALHRQADRVTDELTRRGMGDLVLPTMLRLADVDDAGEPKRRRVERDRLSAAELVVIQSFVDARLLVSDGSTVEVAHEALLRRWTPLREAINVGRADKLTHQKLEEAAVTWDLGHRDSAQLYRGRLLDAASAWASGAPEEPSELAREFLAASKQVFEAGERKRRRTIWLTSAAAVAFLVLSVVAVTTALDARSQKREAERQRDLVLYNQLLANADRLQGTDASLSAQLSLVAHRLKPGDETATRLATAANAPLSTPLPGREKPGGVVAIHPRGHVMATGSDDWTVRLWNVTDPTRPEAIGQPMVGHSGGISALAFSQDGKTLATASQDGTLRLWDVTDPARPRALGERDPKKPAEQGSAFAGDAGWMGSLAFSPDGRTLVAGGRAKSGGGDPTPMLRTWDVSDPGKPASPIVLLVGNTQVSSVAFSQDGRTVAAAADGIRLWNFSDPSRPVAIGGPVPGTGYGITALAFSPDNRTLAGGGDDQAIRLWNVTDPAAPKTLGRPLNGNAGGVRTLAFSPDSTLLAAGLGDATVRLWNFSDPSSPALLGAPLTGHAKEIQSVAFSPDGRTLASGSGDMVRMWQLPSPLLTGHTTVYSLANYVFSLAISPDGRTVAAGTFGKLVWLGDISDPAKPALRGSPLAGHTLTVCGTAFSPDGRVLATGSFDQTVRLWNAVTGEPLGAPLTGHAGNVCALAFSSDGKTLASGSRDNRVQLWNVTEPATATALGPQITSYNAPVDTVTFSPDGHTLVTGSSDGVRLWDVTDPRRVKQLGAPLLGSLEPAAFSPDGKMLATGHRDGSVQLWNVTDPAKPAPHGPPLTGHTNEVRTMAFSPDGRTLATGANEGIMLWHITDPTRPTAGFLLTGQQSVSAVAFRPDGKTLVSGGGDQSIRLWNLDSEHNAARICATTRNTLTEEAWRRYVGDVIAWQPPCS